MAKGEVKINGVSVPCKNVVEIKLVVEGDKLMREITYNDVDSHMCFKQVKVLVDKDKGYEIEKKVRKYCLKY